ncbi:integrase [Paucibacter sp. KBW04]|nr:integrase [Paucibacter sp. KBW04]
MLSNKAVQFYWRYSHGGRTFREAIGVYDSTSPPKKLEPSARGFSVAAARERCRELAIRHAQNREDGGLRGAQIAEREAKARVIMERELAETKAAEAVRERERHSLSALLDDYVKLQQSKGRISAREAKGIFNLHVVTPWPELARAPANELTQDQVVDILRRLVEMEKGRTSNKVRTYLRAAYQCALDVRVTASIPAAFKAYEVLSNPVAHTRRDARFDSADKRPLTTEELRIYWRLIESLPGLSGHCLRLHLLTGGQRIEQLARLRWADVHDNSFTLFDIKGRPGQGPRRHTVPLTKLAARDMNALERVGEHAFSTTEGVKPISGTTLSGWAMQVVGNEIARFQLKRVRSGVETLLAANRVSREIRGHVQSHGLTGIQARHYDGHDYMPEKREALELLARELTRPARAANTARQRRTSPLAERRSARWSLR